MCLTFFGGSGASTAIAGVSAMSEAVASLVGDASDSAAMPGAARRTDAGAVSAAPIFSAGAATAAVCGATGADGSAVGGAVTAATVGAADTAGAFTMAGVATIGVAA